MNLNFTKFTAFLCSFYFLFLISANVLGQGKFLDGYIISPQGDTIRGQVRYDAWDKSPAYIDFIDKNGGAQKITPKTSLGFAIPQVNEKYKGYRIGVLNIDQKESYNLAPSLIAKDSADFFLKEVTSGKHASLFEYMSSAGEAHYFLDKNSKLTELFNYPFYKTVDNKKYLVIYDEYKNQLPAILNDSEHFKMVIPLYEGKSLRKYVEKYNESLGDEKLNVPSQESKSGFTIDLNLGVNLENWQQYGVDLAGAAGFGVGFRVNLPRRFNNRYFRVNAFFNPNVSVKKVYSYTYSDKVTLKTVDFGFGTYFGTEKWRPFAGVDYSAPINLWRTSSLSPHLGISFQRQFNIELSHFIILNSWLSDLSFFNRPRISLTYFLNLNTLFKRK